jgi:hypothetical protein
MISTRVIVVIVLVLIISAIIWKSTASSSGSEVSIDHSEVEPEVTSTTNERGQVTLDFSLRKSAQ